MHKLAARLGADAPARPLDLARVLLVHGDLTARLALKTILQAGGYAVDVVATSSEALAKLDNCRYELVLSDPSVGTRTAARNVLAYARVKEYRPATALLTSSEPPPRRRPASSPEVAIRTENIPCLLGKVADLIGMRASRRYRPLRQTA